MYIRGRVNLFEDFIMLTVFIGTLRAVFPYNLTIPYPIFTSSLKCRVIIGERVVFESGPGRKHMFWLTWTLQRFAVWSALGSSSDLLCSGSGLPLRN